jgi:hypothetical protein
MATKRDQQNEISLHDLKHSMESGFSLLTKQFEKLEAQNETLNVQMTGLRDNTMAHGKDIETLSKQVNTHDIHVGKLLTDRNIMWGGLLVVISSLSVLVFAGKSFVRQVAGEEFEERQTLANEVVQTIKKELNLITE